MNPTHKFAHIAGVKYPEPIATKQTNKQTRKPKYPTLIPDGHIDTHNASILLESGASAAITLMKKHAVDKWRVRRGKGFASDYWDRRQVEQLARQMNPQFYIELALYYPMSNIQFNPTQCSTPEC